MQANSKSEVGDCVAKSTAHSAQLTAHSKDKKPDLIETYRTHPDLLAR